MPAWHTTKRLGNFGIKPSKDRVSSDGQKVTEQGVRIYLAPAWMGGDGAGPEIIDTDKGDNIAANVDGFTRLFGEDWIKGLAEWMKTKGKKYGWAEGRGPERKLSVKITASDLEILNEAKKAKGIEPVAVPDGTAQVNIHGTRMRSR